MNEKKADDLFEQAKIDTAKYKDDVPFVLRVCMAEFAMGKGEYGTLLPVMSMLTVELTKALKRIEELEKKNETIKVKM